MSHTEEKEPPSFLDQYARDGYGIEEGIFSPSFGAQLIAAAKTLPDYRKEIFKPAMMPHRIDPIFLKAMKNPALVTTMEKLVGGKVAGLQSEFFYCPPGTRGFSRHQDNFYVEAGAGVFASAWCPLVDTDPQKGGLIVYPGTQKEGQLPVQKISLPPDAKQDPNANNEETIIPAQYKAVNASVPRGAALYIHGHLAHGSNENKTEEWRYVLLLTYIKEGESFRAGNYAKRAPIDVYN